MGGMRLLIPSSHELTPADLPAVYDCEDGRPSVRLNFVSTVDGSVVGADGRSGSINNDVDGLVFQMLRAWADVIVVGAGTARAEEYDAPLTDRRWTTLREGRPEHPAMAVLSTRGELPDRMDTMGRDDVVALRTAGGSDAVRSAFEHLRAQGHERILFEGGPTLTSLALAAGVVDEVCLTTAPLLVGGSAHRMVDGAVFERAARLVSLVEHESCLLARWRLD